MVAVSEKDRDVLRFLWVDDPNKKNPQILTYRFTLVVFGVSCSPFLLNATIKHHLEKYHSTEPDLVKLILRSIYVDDISYGADSDTDTYESYLKSKKILAEGGFNLRKFVTNSPLLFQQIKSSEDTSSPKDEASQNVKEEDMSYTESIMVNRKYLEFVGDMLKIDLYLILRL